MYKVFSSYIAVGLIVLCFLLIPKNTFAAELTFKVIQDTRADNTTLIEARIDPESKTLNVIEGIISFSGVGSDNLSVQVENGQSILSLWPTPPQYIQSEKFIRFTGGVPGGFDQEGLLFRMRISPAIYGDLEISYIDGNAYLNDGKGTQEPVFSKPLRINSVKSENDVNTVVPFRSYQSKNVIVILLICILLVGIFYGFKKNIKK
jgi:hypothetical protein